jgi:hypothetical protein
MDDEERRRAEAFIARDDERRRLEAQRQLAHALNRNSAALEAATRAQANPGAAEHADDQPNPGTNEHARRTGRPLGALELERVLAAERELGKRAALPDPKPRPYTYEAIADRVKLNRDRVREIEELVKLGWPLRESHPDFPADDGFVRLPTPEEAARLLHSR